MKKKLLLLCTILACHLPALSLASVWDGVDRHVAQSPLGNKVAISAHNCYTSSLSSPAENLSATLSQVHSAISDGADLIELDLLEYDGQVKVAHDTTFGNDKNGPLLSDVLADTALRSANQILFLEVKESDYNEAFIDDLLNIINASGIAREGRPVYLRSFYSTEFNLTLAQGILAEKYPGLAPDIKFSQLYQAMDGLNINDLQSKVIEAKANGFHMVEFNYQTPNLASFISLAKSQGLSVGLWTIPDTMGEVGVTLFRNEVDEITVEYPVAQSRQVLEEQNNLLYVNTAAQTDQNGIIHYCKDTPRQYSFDLSAPNMPTLETLGTGEDRFGGTLIFDQSQQDFLRFDDADQTPGNGFLVNVLINFDDRDIEDGTTRAIVNKADSGAFALELYNPAGILPTVLRFGVHVNGSYRYATYPIGLLNGTESYYITGAYDGNGRVRLFINATPIASGANLQGGVTLNDSPIVVGADPQGTDDTRFHINAKIQMVSIQDWRNH